jgi:myosin heavy subunit
MSNYEELNISQIKEKLIREKWEEEKRKYRRKWEKERKRFVSYFNTTFSPNHKYFDKIKRNYSENERDRIYKKYKEEIDKKLSKIKSNQKREALVNSNPLNSIDSEKDNGKEHNSNFDFSLVFGEHKQDKKTGSKSEGAEDEEEVVFTLDGLEKNIKQKTSKKEEKFRKEIDTLQNKLENKSQKINEIIEGYKEKLLEKDGQLTKTETKYKTMLNNLKLRIEKIKREKRESADYLEEKEKQNKKLMNEIHELKKNYDQKIESLLEKQNKEIKQAKEIEKKKESSINQIKQKHKNQIKEIKTQYQKKENALQKKIQDLQSSKEKRKRMRSELHKKKTLLNDMTNQLNQLKKKLSLEKKQIFNNKPFPLFAFDLNNLLISYKKKYKKKGDYSLKDPIKKIKKQFLTSKPYLAFFFASKHLEKPLNLIERNKYNQIYIEELIKDSSNWKFVDVDVALASHIGAVIEKHKDQITDFYLGSADKDFHILIKTAEKYNINVHLIAVDYFNISKDLMNLIPSDNLHLLYN